MTNKEKRLKVKKSVKLKLAGILFIRIIGDIRRFSGIYIPVKLIQILLNSFYPYLIILLPKFIIDYIIEGKYKSALLYVFILFAVNTIHGLVKQALDYFFLIRTQALNQFYDENLMRKVMSIDYTYAELASTHTLKEEAKKGSGNIMIFINNVQEIITSIITLLISIYAISFINIFIALLIFVIVVFNGFMNYRKNLQDIDMSNQFADLYRKWGYLNYVCRDTANAKEIRFHHLADWFAKRIKFFVDDHESVIRGSFHMQSVTRRCVAVSEMAQSGVIYFYIGLQLWRGIITVGEFTQYIGTILLISSKLVTVINSTLDIGKDMEFVNKYYGFIDLPDDEYDNVGNRDSNDNQEQYCIELKNVWFRYSADSAYILKGLNLKIDAKQKLSIVGRNGCGKTTLIKLLLRLYHVDSGEILLNGKSIYEYSLAEYRKLFSVIFQDFKIFSFTIQDNILMSDMLTDPENKNLQSDIYSRLKEAIQSADLEHMIKKFPDGLYTFINKNYYLNGYDLSGGMQQNLALSRAYYRNAGHIILDEPTAMLDPVMECHIYENFNQLIGNKTAVYISHRMSSSKFCDKIAYIEGGIVKEYGTHYELMEKDEKYALLFNKQAAMFMETE